MMTHKQKGFGLLEIVIASAIIGLALFSLLSVFIITNSLNTKSSNNIRANFLAEEGIEVLRFLRDVGWSGNFSGLNSGIDYYLVFSTSTLNWDITATNPGLIDNLFERKFTLENVFRNSFDDIVMTGGTLDPNTKKIIMEVSWQERSTTSSIQIGTYLSDIFNN